MKGNFILSYDQRDIFKELTDEEAGKLIKSVFDYEIDGKLPDDRLIRIVLIPIKSWLDANRKLYEEKCEKNREIARSRWNRENKNAEECERMPTDTNAYERLPDSTRAYQTVPDDTREYQRVPECTKNAESESEYESESDIINKRKIFKKPLIDDVISYCKERNNKVDPNKWFDHYEANGWMVGNSPMKDWKAAVRTWESNAKVFTGIRSPAPSKQEILPEWFDQELKSEPPSVAEMQEMDELLKDLS